MKMLLAENARFWFSHFSYTAVAFWASILGNVFGRGWSEMKHTVLLENYKLDCNTLMLYVVKLCSSLTIQIVRWYLSRLHSWIPVFFLKRSSDSLAKSPSKSRPLTEVGPLCIRLLPEQQTCIFIRLQLTNRLKSRPVVCTHYLLLMSCRYPGWWRCRGNSWGYCYLELLCGHRWYSWRE